MKNFITTNMGYITSSVTIMAIYGISGTLVYMVSLVIAGLKNRKGGVNYVR